MSAFNKLSQKQSEKLLCSSFIPGKNCCVHYLFQGKTAVSIIYSSEKLLWKNCSVHYLFQWKTALEIIYSSENLLCPLFIPVKNCCPLFNPVENCSVQWKTALSIIFSSEKLLRPLFVPFLLFRPSVPLCFSTLLKQGTFPSSGFSAQASELYASVVPHCFSPPLKWGTFPSSGFSAQEIWIVPLVGPHYEQQHPLKLPNVATQNFTQSI